MILNKSDMIRLFELGLKYHFKYIARMSYGSRCPPLIEAAIGSLAMKRIAATLIFEELTK
jgi:hypothetical protein